MVVSNRFVHGAGIGRPEPLRRKHLSKQAAANLGKNSGWKKSAEEAKRARTDSIRANAAKLERLAKGITAPPLKIVLPQRPALALLVRNRKGKEWTEWGVVSRYLVNEGTPWTTRKEYQSKLEDQRLGWIANGHFGNDAQFKIDTIMVPKETHVYYEK